MGKQKYTEEVYQKAINLRLQGVSIPDIVKQLGIKKPTLNKLFKKRNIYLSEEQKNKLIVGSRWKNYKPIVDNKKKCSRCKEMLDLSLFTIQSSSKTGYSSVCRKCASNYYKSKAKLIKARVRDYAFKNKDKIRESNSNYYQKNKDIVLEKIKNWQLSNPDKVKQYYDKYAKENAKDKVARTALYRAKKQKATPPWLTEEHKECIKEFYRNCPKGYHVDHIIPINGDIMCGLHVPWNLQYLPARENESKGSNFFQPSIVGMCHQYLVKLLTEEEDRAMGMPFGCSISDLSFSREELSNEHVKFIERYEWLGTMGYLVKPEVYVARHKNGHLCGVVVIDQPNSFTKGIEKGLEGLIHRGATSSWAPKNLGSKLVTFACKESVKISSKRIFMAYSDPEAGEIGTIYQAANFRYMGNRFGTKSKYKLPSGKYVNSRYFSKTSTYKRYCKELGIEWKKEWEKENGYKNTSSIPVEVLKILKQMGKEEMGNSEQIYVQPKGKYALILGSDRKEKANLIKKYEKLIPSLPYPKRSKKTGHTT